MTHEGQILETVDGVDVIGCESCQFAHVSPIPERAHELYVERYYVENKPAYFAHAEEDAPWWDLVYDDRLALLERWLAGQGTTTRQLLDVGSGPGAFLAAAKRRGWDGVGLEPSKQAHAYSRAHFHVSAYNRLFDDEAAQMWRGFDAVTLFEVLEHVADPTAMLSRAFDVLNPGGLLLVVVPNDFNPLQAAVRRQTALPPWWIVPTEHVNYFTVSSLYALVRRVGFSVGDLSCTFPMELFLLAGLSYVDDVEVGRQVHGLRKRLELNLERAGLGDLRRAWAQAIARYGVGRDVVLLARKPAAAQGRQGPDAVIGATKEDDDA